MPFSRPLQVFSLIFFIFMAQTWANASEIKVYKSATCDCCSAWIEHLKDAGFEVSAENRTDMSALKTQYAVPQKLRSCHTAIVDGYVIEGHVPAADVQRLLKNKPDIMGLTAPGMPMHSPGMQAKDQAPKDYDVIAFDQDGNQSVFSHY
ncbi:MAG: DUF411 domain-containing protein [Mariprofundaceae bacterium]|nr:DUF411 domain-containing protein [Mariprofundaceae bacterium]